MIMAATRIASERRHARSATTQRDLVACMVLSVLGGTSHVSDMLRHLIASERRHARSAINTIRSVVQEMRISSSRHLGEMRQSMMGGRVMSHISDMHGRLCPTGTIRSEVDDALMPYGHLGEMRPTMICGREMSHISDMQERHSPYSTTLRSARMVLLAPAGTSHVSDMMRRSVLEEVLFLDFHAVIGQKLTVFLGKRLTTMVLFLLGDIAHYHVFVAQTIRKARILFGPSIEKREVRVGLEPLAGRDFDFLYELGHRQCCRKGHKKMHMVRHTADAIETASDIVDKTEHVRIKFSLMLFSNGRDASMSTKHNMIECLRVTHAILTKNNTDYCYPLPRRGNTHKVQLTPYKPIGAVW